MNLEKHFLDLAKMEKKLKKKYLQHPEKPKDN